MYRTNTCGELRLADAGKVVTLAGWVQKNRRMGGMTFVDVRDRYGITQVVFNNDTDADLCEAASRLGREYVVQITGTVAERQSKNPNLPTGDIEIIARELKVLNRSEVPPFKIEDDTDGGDDLRMKYRYLDLRRSCVRRNLELRHRMAFEIRRYLDSLGFLEVETPVLIKSTPEGARDFVVPSRMNPGQFYALPQSPQTFKQLLMVSGFDRYFQIVKCFRDEDLRADRQPEFTQIDCEMSFVEQEDVLQVFEGLVKHIFKYVKDIDFTEPFPRMTWADAMKYYGSDKPDTRFGMRFVELKDLTGGKGFSVMDDAPYVGAICAPGCAEYTRKQLDQLTEFVKRPQVGAKGMMWVKVEADGSIKSSVGKFYTDDELRAWAERCEAKPGDLILILAGETMKTRKQLNELRLEMGSRLGLRDPQKFSCLWVVDFPLFEWDDETQRYYAMHHPFTSPNPDDIDKLETATGEVRATAYDMVVNGN
ncbi:MAG: aspartate--tRNA ligase, partial [Muribaculaceae bacterium]|nr:aspartate--tRNA ligase [Muribaculaceae bacterium]